MSFLHLSLLAGLAVISVPILLHLFGQRQPQLIDFPALRFIRETKQEKRSSWQLRHFLLLLLRVLLLAALAFALARPRVHSATLGGILGVTVVGIMAALATLIALIAFTTKRPLAVWLTTAMIAAVLWVSAALWGYQSLANGPAVPSADQSSPVAAAIIVDNGPSMTYKSNNEVRLETAKAFALWILEQLPVDSRVGVLTGVPIGSLALDPASAKTQVKVIEARGAHVDLLARIRTSLDLVLASELERKEIYVITDLMSAAWTSPAEDLKELLDEYQGEVLVQVIDLGADDQANWQLGNPEPEFVTVPSGSELIIDIKVTPPQASGITPATTVNVELLQEEINPRLPIIRNGELQTAPMTVVDRKVVEMNDASPKTVTLRAEELGTGTNHFRIQLNRNDPLALDNERYVTIVATEPRPTLVVADDSGPGEVLQFTADVDAKLADLVSFSQLAQVDLKKYAVVCLYDPPPLLSSDVSRLKEHTETGGGLFLVLGPSLGSPQVVKSNSINQLLPGELGPINRRDRTDRSKFIDPVAVSHPVFQALSDASVSWQDYPVFSSWTFSNMEANVLQLISLSDNTSPIMLSQEVGEGQVITLCTPIPQTYARDDALWNELWIGDTVWPAWALLRGVLQTLNGADAGNMNFAVGTPISISNSPQIWPSRYELYLPNATSLPEEALDGVISIPGFDQVGIYRLRGVRGDPVSRGFSINAPAADTMLERLPREQLDEQLGAGNYSVAQNRNEVESSVGQARFGRELYPLLMVLLAGLFLAEQAMSNRFYEIKFQTKGES